MFRKGTYHEIDLIGTSCIQESHSCRIEEIQSKLRSEIRPAQDHILSCFSQGMSAEGRRQILRDRDRHIIYSPVQDGS